MYKLEEFKFSDQDESKYFVREKKLEKKLKFAFNYLLNRLPINKLNDDNTFDFEKDLEYNEGKNYTWFFLVMSIRIGLLSSI